MPSIYELKPRFQALLRPLLAPLARAGLTPNAITLLALAGSVLAGVLVALAPERPAVLFAIPAWLLARMALNAIDGMMARELSLASTFGAVLNEVGDVVSDVALYLPLAAVHPAGRWSIVAFVLGAVGTEFCGVLARALGASRRYDGPMGKSDRAFCVGALALVAGFVPGTVAAWPWFFWAFAGATALTSWRRMARSLAELRAAPRDRGRAP